MGIIKSVKTVFFTLVFFFAGESTAENDKTSDYGLFLSPESCFLANQTKQCELQISIHWKTTNPGNYCLYNNLSEVAMACWDNRKDASKEFMLTLEKDIVLELRDQITGMTIFNTPLKLYKKISKLRRKRRNPWSFY